MTKTTLLERLTQMAKHKDGTYVSMDLTEYSKKELDDFVESKLNLKERVDPSTYHITLCYSRTPVPQAERLKGVLTPTAAHPASYEVFPTKTDGFCLVLRVRYAFAEKINADLTKLGATSDYPEYKPHLTLAYNISQKIDPSTLPLPDFLLHFNGIKVAPLDPQFTPENKK